MTPNFALALDLDGVTLHGWHYDPLYRRDWSENIETDIGFRRENLSYIFGHSDYPLIARGKLDLKEFLANVFVDIGYKGEVDRFVDYWHSCDTSEDSVNTELLTHLDCLRHVHGIPMFLVTQQEIYRRDRILKLFQGLNLFRVFGGLFFTCDRGSLKTDPSFFEGISQELKILPENILYFDDSPPYLDAARAVGWNGAQYNTIADFKEHTLIKPLISGPKSL